jgi:hypothetical protein
VQGQSTALHCTQENSRLAWVWFGGGIYNFSDTAPDVVRPSPRHYAASWQVGNKLYILGGKNTTAGLNFCDPSIINLDDFLCSGLSDFWEFDTTLYQWQLLDANVSESVGSIYGTIEQRYLKCASHCITYF